MSTHLRVVVAESSAIVRNGVLWLLHQLPDLSVQAVEVDSPDGLADSLVSFTPDLLIINPAFNSHYSLKRLSEQPACERVKVIALVVGLMDRHLLQGYHGILSLYDDANALASMLRSLFDEEEDQNATEPLSQREREIIVLVAKGLINKEIADQLSISIHTVITHRKNIARKLQIHSSSGLAIYAIANKLVELSEVKL